MSSSIHSIGILVLKFCVCMMGTFKIYSISNSQIHNMVLLTVVTMLYLSFLGLKSLGSLVPGPAAVPSGVTVPCLSSLFKLR